MTTEEMNNQLKKIDSEIDHWLAAKRELEWQINTNMALIHECQLKLRELGAERSKIATFELGL